MYETRIPAKLAAWNEARRELEEELSRYGFTPAEAVSFLVAAEEAFANIASYAYPERDGECVIRLEDAGENGVRLTFTDRGIPFDPTAYTPREPIRQARGEKPGGFGIAMMRERTDEIRYEQADGRNRLTLIRYHKEGEQ
ncbi:MAG: ATP-binding protein [Lachnospiraceae bacterium]|nr:ATP-binding protein [Lachnospiraceae bacterium]